MELVGKAKRVRIYVNEGHLIGHQPAHVAIVEFLRGEDAAGATVYHGIEGFGGGGDIHTSRFVDLDQGLPIIVEWIDDAARVERLLEPLKQMVERGLITVEDTDVVLCSPQPVRRVSTRLVARDVMSCEVAAVERDAPVREVVELLVGKRYRAVPVVDRGVPVGIITNTDLVTRGGLAVRLELLPSLDTPELRAELDRLGASAKTAGEVMTPAPVVVRAGLPLPLVADLMARRHVKRVPVVDEHQALVGMVSRLDLLRTVAEAPRRGDGAPLSGLRGDQPISQIARRDVPTVFPETPLAEVLQAVISTRLNRAIVVDHGRHVIGIVTDAELLERVTPSLRPNAIRALMHRLPFTHPSPRERAAEQHGAARTAGDLMLTDVTPAFEDTPLREAIGPMLRAHRKIVPVVDRERRLVGIVDRADLLRGLLLPQRP
jgi:CBS domain-containing protein